MMNMINVSDFNNCLLMLVTAQSKIKIGSFYQRSKYQLILGVLTISIGFLAHEQTND